MEEKTNQEEMTYEEAIRWIREYIRTTGKTQSEVAAELGVTGGLISGFLSGKYKSPGGVSAKVAELARLHEKKAVVPKAPDYAETSVSRIVLNAIEYARLRGTVAVVYGDAGVGKTCAINQYKKADSTALVITISPTYASIAGINELIGEILGIRERTARKITREIVGKLRGSGRVLIVDEAQHLTVRALNHLRCISDEAGIGIALVGNEEVYSKLRGSGRAEFAQLFSRIGMRKQVLASGLKQEDVQKIFGPYGLEADAVELLTAVSRTMYGLRGAVNAYINAAAVYGRVDRSGLVKIMKDMNIG